MAKIAAIIPVYNAESCLEELLKRLIAVLSGISPDFQILLIEDCSTDRSWEAIESLAQSEPRICGLHFSRNFGQHNAIAAGLDHCDGDWVVIMDCDLQDAPEEIERLYERALQGFDVVLARRRHRNESWVRVLSSRVFATAFSYFTEREFDMRVGAFRILSRRVVEAYRQLNERDPYLPGAISWLGFPTASIDIVQNSRFAGQSGYTLRKLLRLAAFSVVAYSDKPLRLTIKCGLGFSAMSILFGIVLVFDHLFDEPRLPGWSSIIVSIYLIGGLTMACVGVVGLYIGKIFDLARDRPPYVIATAVQARGTLKHYFAKASSNDPPELVGRPPYLQRSGSPNRSTDI
jgi:glycosyltransferase involved in cell wall biosynthesis